MGPPRRRKTRMGYCTRTVTDVQPDIVLALALTGGVDEQDAAKRTT